MEGKSGHGCVDKGSYRQLILGISDIMLDNSEKLRIVSMFAALINLTLSIVVLVMLTLSKVSKISDHRHTARVSKVEVEVARISLLCF